MRRLYDNEEPVLPVGFQDLVTGDNRYFNVFKSWGNDRIANISLIRASRNNTDNPTDWSNRLILSGMAKPKASLYHDQTHNFIADYVLAKEYHGTYRQMFDEIMKDTGKKKFPAYVYK
jgi:hypothetical protein